MKKHYIALLLCIFSIFGLSAQNVLLETSFEGPGFDRGWTKGVSQGIDISPEDYPETGLDPWEKWDITETTAFGYVHSGDSAAWIGGTLYDEPTHDWLMTPKMPIPDTDDVTMYYWLWYHSEAAYVNRFYIMIFDYETEEWEQGYLLANDFNSPYHYIEEYSFDLSPWRGKEIMIAFVKNGTYQMAMDDVRVVYNEGASVNDLASSEMKIYPNPAKDVVKIKVADYNNDDVVTISDISGRVLLTQNVTGDEMNIDISALAKGMYLVKVGDVVNKIVKE